MWRAWRAWRALVFSLWWPWSLKEQLSLFITDHHINVKGMKGLNVQFVMGKGLREQLSSFLTDQHINLKGRGPEGSTIIDHWFVTLKGRESLNVQFVMVEGLKELFTGMVGWRMCVCSCSLKGLKEQLSVLTCKSQNNKCNIHGC